MMGEGENGEEVPEKVPDILREVRGVGKKMLAALRASRGVAIFVTVGGAVPLV